MLIERSSGMKYPDKVAKHWVRGLPSTALSVADDENPEVYTRPVPGGTPAVLFKGVWYLFDKA